MLRRLIRLCTLCSYMALSAGLLAHLATAYFEHFNPYVALCFFVGVVGFFFGILEIYLLKRNNDESLSQSTQASTKVYMMIDDEYLETIRISLLSCKYLRGSHDVSVICRDERYDVESLCHELNFSYYVGSIEFDDDVDQYLITNGHCILYPDSVIVAQRRLNNEMTFVELNHSIYSSHALGSSRAHDDASRASLIAAAAGSYAVPVYTGGPILIKSENVDVHKVRDNQNFVDVVASALSGGQRGTITSHPCCECLSDNEIDHNISSRIARYEVSRKLTQHSQYVDTAFGIIRHSIGWMYMRYFWFKSIAFAVVAMLILVGLVVQFPREMMTLEAVGLISGLGITHFFATYVRGDRRRSHERLRDVLLDCEALIHAVSIRYTHHTTGHYRIQFIPLYITLLIVAIVFRCVRLGNHLSLGSPQFTTALFTLTAGVVTVITLYRAMYRYLTARQRAFARRHVSITGSSSYESMWIVDLTHRGAAYITDFRFELGDETPLVFRIPTMSDDSLITVVGKVTYCAPRGNSYQVGVAFKELSQSALDDLMLYCSVIYPYHQARNIEDTQNLVVRDDIDELTRMSSERNYLSVGVYSLAIAVLVALMTLSIPLGSSISSAQSSQRVRSYLIDRPLSDSVNALGVIGPGTSSSDDLNTSVVTLGASFYRDDNVNAKHDTGEGGLQGLKATLYRSDHEQVLLGSNGAVGDEDDSADAVVSDEFGDISFRFIEPGTYYAIVTGVSDDLQLSEKSQQNAGVQKVSQGYKTALFSVDARHNGNIEQLNVGFVGSYDLQVTHALTNADQSGYIPGDEVHIAVTVINTGKSVAKAGYKLTSQLSDDFDEQNIQMRSTSGFTPCGFSGSVLECVGNRDLGPGESRTVEFEVTSHVSPSSASSRREVISRVHASQKDHAESLNLLKNNVFSSVLPVGQSASIGDRVFLDFNSNGTHDQGEAGIPDVRVGLRQYKDTNGDGIKDPGETQEIAHDVTDANGYFGVSNGKAGFQNLNPDQEYALTFSSLPKGFIPITQTEQQDDDDGRDNILYTTHFVTLNANTLDLDRDLAVGPPKKKLSTTIFIDRTKNSRFDKSEKYFQGYDVRLLQWIDENGNNKTDEGEIDDSVAYSTLSSKGRVDFGEISSSIYPTKFALEVDVAQGYEFPSGTSPYANRVRSKWLDAQAFSKDIAMREVGSSVTGNIYTDFNVNGQQDPTEYGIPGVSVSLLDSQNKRIATARTTTDGTYVLEDVPSGTFVFGLEKNTIPDGFLEKSIGSSRLTRNVYGDPDASFEVSADQSTSSYDFTLVPVGTLRGVATAGSGGRTSIENSAITLLSSKNIVGRIHSDARGEFQFVHIIPGEYEVQSEHSQESQRINVYPGLTTLESDSSLVQGPLHYAVRGQFEEVELSSSEASTTRNITVLMILGCASLVIATLIRRKKLISRSQ